MPAPRLNSHATKERREEVEGDGFNDFMINQIKQLPVTVKVIAEETRKDPHLSTIIQNLEAGGDLGHLGYKASEVHYSLGGGRLVFEHRMMIPTALRKAMLEELHTAHLGIVKMKGMERSFICWLGIDVEIEQLARPCTSCARNVHEPAKTRNHHW